MRLFIILSLIAGQAFAIDFHKVTGTFDVKATSEAMGEETLAQVTFGTFDLVEGRTPASIQHDDEKSDTHVTEITGTFE